MNNKNTSKIEPHTPEYMATLTNGTTKRYVLMRPNPENSSQPGKIEFFKGVPVQIDQAIKEHLEKNAVFFKTAHFPDGTTENSSHCSFEFTALGADELANDAEPAT